jgi:ketosteroid isomerase-like protein
VVKLQPSTPTLFGKDAIVGALRADLEAVAWQTMDIATGEVVGDGDLAFARGTFTLAGQTRDVGQQLSFDGKFLTVFRRQPDGSWRIIRDVYNFDS